MPQKLWNKYDRTFEAKGQKVQRWQKNSLYVRIYVKVIKKVQSAHRYKISIGSNPNKALKIKI